MNNIDLVFNDEYSWILINFKQISKSAEFVS